jgi:hypothetical protein
MVYAVLGVVYGIALSSCGNSERNVITNKAPFYQTEVGTDDKRADAVISTVRSFAAQHHMDFLLAKRTLPAGDFNASANSSSINLHAMHSSGLDRGVVIFAISKGDPTPEDKALAKDFVTKVRISAEGSRMP